MLDVLFEGNQDNDNVEGDVTDMCEFLDYVESLGEERGYARGEADGEVRGEHYGKRKMINNMLESGMSMEDISKCAKISIEEIKQLLAENTAKV